jgi:hypothetical protein
MAKSPEKDPTQDPEFQKVLRHFVTTPPQPHKPKAESDARGKAHKAKKANAGPKAKEHP